MSFDCLAQKEKHQVLLQEWFDKHYAQLENDSNEFTHDGPCNWELWCLQKPKILFLMKEARQGFHPSCSNQSFTNKTGWNLARWYFAITTLFNIKQHLLFPEDTELPESFDSFAIVEVKKLDENKSSSLPKIINSYAEKDREYLKKQIAIIDPHVIICCGTEDAYDIIYKDTPEILEAEQLTFEENFNCWNIDNRLVIEFRHPATFPSYIVTPNTTDRKLFDILCQRITEGNIFDRFNW